MTACSQKFEDIQHWIFDLDNTLYPPESELFSLIDKRMTQFISDTLDMTATDALKLQKQYYHEHGTTLAGLMANHGLPPGKFLDFVHDISLDRLSPDAMLTAALHALPGQVYVFTNGSIKHGQRVCDALGISDAIDEFFGIDSAKFIPKPQPQAFSAFLKTHPLPPQQAVMFEDLPKNLKPAKQLGMQTVLVGPMANKNTDSHVDWRTANLVEFLQIITKAYQ